MAAQHTPRRTSLLVATVVLLFAALMTPVAAHPDKQAHHNPLPAHASETMRAFAEDQQSQFDGSAVGPALCADGLAGPFPCSNVDLHAFMPLSEIGGTRSSEKANDIWGWTDSYGEEYAIIGRVFGTSFVRISGDEPVYLGDLPTHGAFGSSWRDIKVYNDHAFIVSEANQHGMQVFDLRQLSSLTSSVGTFAETAHYSNVASAHNLAINEHSGYAYIVGASGKNSCSGGLHMVDINNPANPSFAGCYSGDGYTHDTQCVNYTGPDPAYQAGQEICFNSNEDTLTIVDVSNKRNPVLISRTSYSGVQYTHQGWLTADQTTFLLDDELDEQRNTHNTLTRVFDVSDLDAPTLPLQFTNETAAIDHNQYVRGDRVFQANYRAGLRILDIRGIAADPPALSEAGYFDVYPDNDDAEFNGAWSTYPYFGSGKVVISGIEQGLFVVNPSTAAAGDKTWAGPGDSGDGGGGGGTTPTPAMHVGDLDGSAQKEPKGRWSATVTIEVHDSNDVPLDGATVTGSWSNGAAGENSCTTTAGGRCTVSTSTLHNSTGSATFTVMGVTTTADDLYDQTQNHDEEDEDDSNGTTITVIKP